MTFLAIDTCTERMIIARRSTTPGTVDQWVNLDAQGNHAKQILPAMASLLGEERPDVVGVALGPGSFTGVRIGLATAKGLADGWGVPLVGLDNLAAMASAWEALTPGSGSSVFPVIDARKKKFYGAVYRSGAEIVAPADRSASDWVAAVLVHTSGPVTLTGYQGTVMAEALGAGLPVGWTVFDTLDWAPGLLDQLVLGWETKQFLPADAAPRYLRLSEAEENLRSRPA